MFTQYFKKTKMERFDLYNDYYQLLKLNFSQPYAEKKDNSGVQQIRGIFKCGVFKCEIYDQSSRFVDLPRYDCKIYILNDTNILNNLKIPHKILWIYEYYPSLRFHK